MEQEESFRQTLLEQVDIYIKTQKCLSQKLTQYGPQI